MTDGGRSQLTETQAVVHHIYNDLLDTPPAPARVEPSTTTAATAAEHYQSKFWLAGFTLFLY